MSLTLWDLLEPILPRRPAKKPAPEGAGAGAGAGNEGRASQPRPGRSIRVVEKGRVGEGGGRVETMQEKYDRVVSEMLAAHGVKVRKWRTSMTGIAWYITYNDGSVKRLIESPKPRGPMSMAIFLHEIGHHAIGFNVYKPRCLEEYHAWAWSLRTMESLGLNVTEQVHQRMHESLHYAIGKATRRGIRSLPVELQPYVAKPPARRKRARSGL